MTSLKGTVEAFSFLSQLSNLVFSADLLSNFSAKFGQPEDLFNGVAKVCMQNHFLSLIDNAERSLEFCCPKLFFLSSIFSVSVSEREKLPGIRESSIFLRLCYTSLTRTILWNSLFCSV